MYVSNYYVYNCMYLYICVLRMYICMNACIYARTYVCTFLCMYKIFILLFMYFCGLSIPYFVCVCLCVSLGPFLMGIQRESPENSSDVCK